MWDDDLKECSTWMDLQCFLKPFKSKIYLFVFYLFFLFFNQDLIGELWKVPHEVVKFFFDRLRSIKHDLYLHSPNITPVTVQENKLP